MKLKNLLMENKRLILTGVILGEVIIDSILWYKSGLKINEILKDHKEEIDLCDQNDKRAINAVKLETGVKIAKIVAGPVLATLATFGTVILSYEMTTKEMMILGSALAANKERLKATRTKMKEIIGDKKVAEIDGAIAQDRVKGDKENLNIHVTPYGEVPCKDYYTNGWFTTSYERIQYAKSRLEEKIQSEMFVSLNDFYTLIGYDLIPYGDDIGWSIEDCFGHSLPIECKAVLNDWNVPVLSLVYDISTKTYREHMQALGLYSS